jgi:hypothetical protein
MTTRIGATPREVSTPAAEVSGAVAPEIVAVYQEGFLAGIVGAITVALWFLVVDALAGRPFHTPTVLGTALFRRGAGLGSPETLAVSFEMVWMFTWVHVLAFAALGGIASRLLAAAERNPSLGFGVLLLFVVFEAGFTSVLAGFAAPALQALNWPSVLVANLLAAAAMAGYFRLRHPRMQVSP